MKYGDPTARTSYGVKGEGGRDLQIGTIRVHSSTRAHKQALESEARTLAAKEKQVTLTRWKETDASTRHIIRCLHIAMFVCKADAPIAMFVPLCRFLAKEGLPDLPPNGGYGAYYTEYVNRPYGFKESLRATSACLQETQRLHLLESPWMSLSLDESTDRIHGKHLIIYVTYLKNRAVVNEFLTLITVDRADAASLSSAVVQYLTDIGVDLQKETGITTNGASVMGIHTVRWQSRGEAIARLLEVLPAAIDVLKDYKPDLYEVVTSFKFHWLLRFLADILWELNHLNQRFQQRQIDVTLVAHIVEQTCMRLKAGYLSGAPGHTFGSGECMTLPDFFLKHQKQDKREMKVKGVDCEGNLVSFTFVLHERPLKGQETDGDVTTCYELSLKFVRAIDKELEWWMRDLANLEGSKLFHTASYLTDDAKRVDAFKRWLGKLHKLYHEKLPGVCQHNGEDFHQALSNMMRDDGWRQSFPNIMKMWQAVAVLPLSTMECERGFSKQNLIKTWDRGCLSDTSLEHLMRCSLVQYEVDWFEVVAIFRGEKLRRSTKYFTGSNESKTLFAQEDVEGSVPTAM
ncbi:unnamed protein product [Closterium sp. NIES-53]